MAYDEALADRVRVILGDRPGISERRMFGGLCFMVDGKMFMGVGEGEVMCRVGPEAHDDAMAKPGVRVMDFTGRPMQGYVYAGSPSIDDDGLKVWVDQTYAFASALPPKVKKPAKRAARK